MAPLRAGLGLEGRRPSGRGDCHAGFFSAVPTVSGRPVVVLAPGASAGLTFGDAPALQLPLELVVTGKRRAEAIPIDAMEEGTRCVVRPSGNRADGAVNPAALAGAAVVLAGCCWHALQWGADKSGGRLCPVMMPCRFPRWPGWSLRCVRWSLENSGQTAGLSTRQSQTAHGSAGSADQPRPRPAGSWAAAGGLAIR